MENGSHETVQDLLRQATELEETVGEPAYVGGRIVSRGMVRRA